MRDRSPIQSAALLVGLVFLLVGILGFIPGITTNYDELKFAGHDSNAQLLGLFDVSILHNIVHLLFGIAGVALAKTWDGARTYLVYGGVIYLGAVRLRPDLPRLEQRELRPGQLGGQHPPPRARHRDDHARSRTREGRGPAQQHRTGRLTQKGGETRPSSFPQAPHQKLAAITTYKPTRIAPSSHVLSPS